MPTPVTAPPPGDCGCALPCGTRGRFGGPRGLWHEQHCLLTSRQPPPSVRAWQAAVLELVMPRACLAPRLFLEYDGDRKKRTLPNGEKKDHLQLWVHTLQHNNDHDTPTDRIRVTYTETQRIQESHVQRCTASDTQRASARQEKEKRREHVQNET